MEESAYEAVVEGPPGVDILARVESERRGNEPTVISDSAKSLRKLWINVQVSIGMFFIGNVKLATRIGNP